MSVIMKKAMTEIRRWLSVRFYSGRISQRFRNINVLLFAAAFCIMAAVMFFAFNNVTNRISADYAGRYAASSAEALSAHIARELDLMFRISNSDVVIDWVLDEFDEQKKSLAFKELTSVVGEYYSYHLYIGIQSSLNQYKVESSHRAVDFEMVAVLDEHNPTDAWHFDCIRSEYGYLLKTGIDNEMQRKRLFVDFKVEKDGEILGVICTGLEFSHVTQELFSHYDSNDMRGFIIDENSAVLMDSSLMRDKEFMNELSASPIKDVLDDPYILSVIESHQGGADGYWDGTGQPGVFKTSTGLMTIAPIKDSGWSVIILSEATTLFDNTYFILIIATVLLMLVAFALVTNASHYRMIFKPLGKLERSLAMHKENSNEPIYGTERDDELGELSKTIQDLITKANIDALTGIYNRRFMEANLERTMGYLSRQGGMLSVLMLDIDFFKKYNDTYGHEQGDKCLKAVAMTLSGAITRASDFVARYGGEEFVAILPNTDEPGARLVAEKIIENVRSINIPHVQNAAAPYVTVSVGVTTGNVKFMQGWETYVKRADEALYMSKEHGRNQYTYLDFLEEE